VPPGEPFLAQRPVIDQAVLGVLRDLQVVVDRVAQHDLRLRPGGGEDKVLHLPPGRRRRQRVRAALKERVRVGVDDLLGDREELGQLPVPEPWLDVPPLAPPRVLARPQGRQSEAVALLDDVVGLHLRRQDPGYGIAQDRRGQPLRRRRPGQLENVAPRHARVAPRRHRDGLVPTAHTASFPACTDILGYDAAAGRKWASLVGDPARRVAGSIRGAGAA
jgi:hypothetical protein